MNKPHSHVIFGSRPFRSRSKRPRRPRKTDLANDFQLGPHPYQPQKNTEDDQELQSPPSAESRNHQLEARESSVWYQVLLRDKLVNFFIVLIPCLYLFDCILNWASINGLPFTSIHQQGAFISEMQGSMSRPLQFMSANLNADPILDIQIKDQGFPCPHGFEALKLGYWPGTVAGCLCENGDLHRTSCNDIGSAKCKKDIPETSPIGMYEWNDSLWCIKRAVLDQDYVKEIECPSRSQECYPGGCFFGDCPVTKIEIASTGEAANKFKNEKNKYLTLTKTKGELPLINIQVTFGDIPCFTQELFTQFIKNSSYGLSAVKEYKCDKYGLNHQLSTRLASQTAYDSFIQNAFPYSITNLPGFEKNAKATTAILSSMVRMKTAKHDHCLNLNNENPIEKFRRAWGIHTESMTMTWVFILLCLVIYRVIHILQFYVPSLDQTRSTSSRNSEGKPILFIFCGSSFIFLFGYFVTCYGLNKIFESLKEYFEGYESFGCFEGSQGSMVISDSLEIIRKIDGSFWVYQTLFISSILSILSLYWLFFGKRERRPDPN